MNEYQINKIEAHYAWFTGLLYFLENKYFY